jgi:hypothetical protein
MKRLILTVAVATVALAILATGRVLYLHGRRTKSAQPCWGKLVNIEAAKEQWAIETKAISSAPVTLENILPYLAGTPTCHVAGAKYIVRKIGEEPACTVHGTVSHFKPDRY